ncbi:hypothetical protein Pfo_000839 [Paulownia fortunei]|nr:hypothetical protein Pfo_000839 [Paulownia fortunei]
MPCSLDFSMTTVTKAANQIIPPVRRNQTPQVEETDLYCSTLGIAFESLTVVFESMTTKLQHSINPLTRAPHNNFAVNPLSIHQCFPELEVGLHKVESSMDRMLELQNIESMRKTMLMQEELFKQQVQDLHRLYNLQKKLMQELENGLTRRKEVIAQTETTNSEFAVWNKPATETGHSFQAFSARDDPKELSSSCSGESSRMPIKFDLEMPAESTPSSIHLFEEQKDMKRIDEETDVEVELTLSIGHCTRKQRSKSTQLHDSDQSKQVGEHGSSSTKTNKGEEYGEPSSIISSSSVYQENTRPRWLLQDLSLNRT